MRTIGLDTSQTKRQYKPMQTFGQEVLLEFEVQRQDTYSQSLA